MGTDHMTPSVTEAVRKLCAANGLTPAETDIALQLYEDGFIEPFGALMKTARSLAR
jgi:hypothetical protein